MFNARPYQGLSPGSHSVCGDVLLVLRTPSWDMNGERSEFHVAVDESVWDFPSA
jgi:hypothetical protein